jgi:hypothetical protein
MNEGLVADEVKIVGLIWRPAPREGGLPLRLSRIGLEFIILGCFEAKNAF